jgi:hypothetical protein
LAPATQLGDDMFHPRREISVVHIFHTPRYG